MTIQRVPDEDLTYYLISFDKKGRERTDDPDSPSGQLSHVVQKILKTEPVTDLFLMSHGWKGDMPASIRQYDAWIGAMARCKEDRQKIREIRPGFRALLVGLHWPSLPWGVEDQQVDPAASFGVPASDPLVAMIDDAAGKIADTPPAREALQTIFEAAVDDVEPVQLPPSVVEAYETLFAEAELTAAGLAGAPGDDAVEFDPDKAYRYGLADQGDAAISFGGVDVGGGIFTVLRQLSFWKMKQRARVIGESGVASLLREFQIDVPDAGTVRFHLMGHSFGCIVVSAAVAGPGGDAPLPRPVDSMFLVQGALSLWSYCESIPAVRDKSGYFHSIIRDGKVAGPIVTTQSEHDAAVGRLYPLAAGIKRQVDFAPGDLPKYGALGAFGSQGLEVHPVNLEMKAADEGYNFDDDRVYNVDGSEFICVGGGLSGAHSDIAKPPVAHTFWEEVMTT